MAPNKSQPHVLILPEDRANQDIANGFHLEVDWNCLRRMQVLPVAGGRDKVVETFLSEHVIDMERFPTRFMVLLIDCDSDEQRLVRARRKIPAHLLDRVFVFGVLTKPEALNPQLGSFEEVGRGLADDCRLGEEKIWSHTLLKHNVDELRRARPSIASVLFN